MATNRDIMDLIPKLEAAAEASESELDIDAESRQRLYDAARAVMLRVEQGKDTLQRIGVSPLQAPIAKLGHNLNIFERLVASGPMKLDELASITGVQNHDMLSRILKFCASHNMIAEVGVNEYTASNITRSLADPAVIGAVIIHHELTQPSGRTIPEYLPRTNFATPVDDHQCPFQDGMNTNDAFFEYLEKHPDLSRHFNNYMSVPRSSKELYDLYDFSGRWGNGTEDETALFVDVGGGRGHQCVSLLKKSKPKGRIILQDLEHVVKDVKLDDVEVVPHSFYDEQPVKGAKVYYMRAILHDHSDERCRQILTRIRDAMGPDSVLLLDERVIPSRNAHWFAMNMDIAMMVSLAAYERSETQWAELIESVGLKIRNINRYHPSSYSIVEVVKV